MRAFIQKQNQPQQWVSSSITRSSTTAPAASHQAHPILHLQSTIGNQAVQRLLGQAEPDDLGGRSSTKEVTRFAHDFSQIPVHAKSPASAQAKLTVSSPGDIYEQEANRVSEQVMRMSEPQLQRTCACGGECPKCQTEQPSQEHERLQTTRVGSSDLGQAAVPSIVHEVLSSSGQCLDPAPRAFMESRFGHDFSRVRVHSDARAAESAQAVNALAYTVGRNIVFGAGQYRPGMAAGKLLLAHELTHVVQQTSPAVKVNAASASLDERTSRALRDSTGIVAVSNSQRQTPTVSPALTILQRKRDDKGPAKAPPKPAPKCPDGFTLKRDATWLRCEETTGTRVSGCSFCNEGEQESRCEKILELLGNHRVIAPVAGRCGSKFQITTPQPGAPVIDVVKAEIPGGTELDINQDVITDLGLNVETGRYDVCLKGPIGHDDRLVITGGSACQKPKKQPEKTKAK
jgi:hypothetical protein